MGAVSLHWLVLPRVRSTPPDAARDLHRTAARFGSNVALVLPLAFGLVFARQLIEFRDPFVPWAEDARLLLTGTEWGTVFLIGSALGLSAIPAFRFAAAERSWGWPLATIAALALCAFPAFTGHANAGEGTLRLVTLSADVLHVWAAGGWMGGLAGVLFLNRRAGSGLLPNLVPAFSPVAVACVTVLVVTGSLASWIHLPDLGALVRGAYGRTLLLKLALVAGVLGLGWVNWRRHTPRLDQASGEETLRQAAALELILAQLVLLATALLVRTPPSG